MCHWYIEYRFCSQGPHCLGNYGWANASSQLYVRPYASIRRNHPCEQSSRRGGCGQSTRLGPGSDIKTSDHMCGFCRGDVPKTDAGKKNDGDGGKGDGDKMDVDV
ncbi:hypothetical protein B0H65DRAFT_480864 [Neurospora tetraspora]|uniref:Uncharacterized protein n=1 Tax=Neurospora tetraspora TaxID=94610 RepID=A0AAE0J011_9PEZI|nr:hypothetical protein B0H65DRAFT_480864 [Neurospora tetraspora]